MSLDTFKEKLNNIKEPYALCFANEDDSAYFFESYGGEERLKTKFPAIYNSYLKSKAESLKQVKNGSDNVPSNITAEVYDIEFPGIKDFSAEELKDDPYVEWKFKVSCVCIDQTKKVSDPRPADPWTGITIAVKVKNHYRDEILYETPFFSPSANQIETFIYPARRRFSDFKNQQLTLHLTVAGKDPSGGSTPVVFPNHVQDIGQTKVYLVERVIIDDPSPKTDQHKKDEIIYMYYGRKNNDGDYEGGEYYDNSLKDGVVRLIMPIKGELILHSHVKPIELTKPTSDEKLCRSKVSYSYKNSLFTFREDIIDDNLLYNQMKTYFHNIDNGESIASKVKFEIASTITAPYSKYDWYTNVDGIADGSEQTFMLNGQFRYDFKNQGNIILPLKIEIKSLKRADLAEHGGQYYKYNEEQSSIYIPPILVIWGCYGKDVLIKLADNTEKNACEIRVGDVLIDSNNRSLVVNDITTGKDVQIYQIKTENGGEIKVSGGHPMMCDGKCVRACKLQPGDKLNFADGSLSSVSSVESIDYNDIVYNFTFEGEENGVYLIANGFYSGDLNMQNEKPEVKEYELTDEDKLYIAEVLIHQRELEEKRNHSRA